MPITTMSHMWAMLDCFTLTNDDVERPVNHLNEWGGFSRRLNMPVFTGWADFAEYDRTTKTTKALVLDAEWQSKSGINNQIFWLSHAEKNMNGIAAFFVIHAVDTHGVPRKVKYIDDDKVFVGRIIREGTKTFISGQPKPI